MADLAADMATARLDQKDAEEAWIAKYRNALKEVPVRPSHSAIFREALNRAQGLIVSRISGILARSLDASFGTNHGKRSVQSSKPIPVSQPPATRNRNLAESNVKVA
jgi:hypothetical protein